MLQLPPLIGYQERALTKIRSYVDQDPSTPVLAVGPCGCGKSRLMFELTEDWLSKDKRVGILTHRQMLTEQLADDFRAAGTPFSILSDGYKFDEDQPVAIMSAPTVFSRCFRKGTTLLPPVDYLLVDEAHQQTGNSAQAILYGAFKDGFISDGYIFSGASVIGFTATPAMRAGLYGRLVDIGSYSDMRRAGMHQLVKVFSPDEIDVKGLKAGDSGDFSEKELEKRVKGSVVIFGSVYREYKIQNPGQLPMILFAPSIETSKWFAQCFCSEGVPVAHLDGEIIGWPDMTRPQGDRLVWMDSSKENRRALLDAHRDGTVKGISNRFVLREAVNMPWAYHAIFATVMGGLTTYLQAVGRLQRYWPAYTHKILQCHGGHYWRHGSPNEDRVWKIGDTNRSLGRVRIEAILKGEKPEGIRCPKCGGWRLNGPVCPHCSHTHNQSVRAVRSISGRLKQMVGQVYVAPTQEDQVQRLWSASLFSGSAHDRPCSAVVAIFMRKCQDAGLKVDWDKIRNRPPHASSVEWHWSVNDYYPWLKRNREKKASERLKKEEPETSWPAM